MSAEIKFPEIGHREGISKVQKQCVEGVLAYMQNDLKFIDGRFINEFSTQRFAGNSAKTAGFIDLLAQAKLWELKVRFDDFGEQTSALTLHQSSPEALHIIINSGKDDFLLKDFQKYLTEIILPKKGNPNTAQSTGTPFLEIEKEGRTQLGGEDCSE